jgi:hypothetical protein
LRRSRSRPRSTSTSSKLSTLHCFSLLFEKERRLADREALLLPQSQSQSPQRVLLQEGERAKERQQRARERQLLPFARTRPTIEIEKNKNDNNKR